MMPEISLNILDVAQNSLSAKATLVEITIDADTKKDTLYVTIKDNGCGMTKEQIERVSDPFYTTRKTRKVGLGIPFFKAAALATGGEFKIDSDVGVGTVVTAVFVLSHIDRMPMGDITSTMQSLITMNSSVDFLYTYKVDDRQFVLDTVAFREVLGDVPFDNYEVSEYIRDYLSTGKDETDKGIIL